jgi:outer membrane immunogenic protein
VGFQLDASFSDAEERQDVGGGAVLQSDLDWLASVRLRAGYAFDNLLVFATVGGAAAETDDRIEVGGVNENSRQSRKGWTAGAGLEWAFSENWTAVGEYQYVDLGTETVTEDGTPAFPGAAIQIDFEHIYHLGRVGVNYRF